MSGWPVRVVTLLPEAYPGVLGHSLAGRALQQGIWSLQTISLRDFGVGKHQAVDDTPAGGGVGMVMRADSAANALDAARHGFEHLPMIAFSPRGAPLTQKRVRELASGDGLILFCGRFEGTDERLFAARDIEEICVGDYILAGGDSAAQLMLDAIIRLLPGVMGKAASADDESFADGLLEYPHYTRPVEWEGHAIPDILLSGHHGDIAQWRHAQAQQITQTRRPDLWAHYRKKNHDS